jgi:hypothetical protein
MLPSGVAATAVGRFSIQGDGGEVAAQTDIVQGNELNTLVGVELPGAKANTSLLNGSATKIVAESDPRVLPVWLIATPYGVLNTVELVTGGGALPTEVTYTNFSVVICGKPLCAPRFAGRKATIRATRSGGENLNFIRHLPDEYRNAVLRG